MLIRPELIDRLAETLEGIAVSNGRDGAMNAGSRRDASVLIYHSSTSAAGGPVAGESPLVELTLSETDGKTSLTASSALGIVELHEIDEVRLLIATEEAAFYSHGTDETLSVLTVSSRGILQVYMNIPESLGNMELSDVRDDDLRAAVALKIFAEHAEVFSAE